MNVSRIWKMSAIENKTTCTATFYLRSLSITYKYIRLFYLGGALCFVCFGFYNSMVKMKENRLSLKEEKIALPKYRYPSITFCYVFKNHNKDVMEMYYQHLLKAWKKSGKFLFFSFTLDDDLRFNINF